MDHPFLYCFHCRKIILANAEPWFVKIQNDEPKDVIAVKTI